MQTFVLKNLINFALAILVVSHMAGCSSKSQYRKISLEEYQSKMMAGWLGQMAGVGWGAPTEFRYNAIIIPEEEVPEWNDGMINQHFQDDIYVEMTFLKTLEDHGFDVSIRQAGIDFANSQYPLWHANRSGRENLRNGIAPPYSGHPRYNSHADDIDYQIEADYSGLISPGMPQTVIDLGEIFGRIMNYGDGLYGGVFIGAMYSEAFFEKDIHKIIRAGLACIPAESQYAQAINDVIKWHSENTNDWQKTWQLIEHKYNLNHDHRKFSCNGAAKDFNIDAKINGAYVVLGLLYGEGDMDKTITISMRCGMDSDCNPSNAAGILATSLGMEELPSKFKSGIDETTKFAFTTYDFSSLLHVCELLTKEAVVRAGGKVELNDEGNMELLIPIDKPTPQPLQQSWEVEETIEDISYTAEELRQITVVTRKAEDHVTNWQVAGPFTQNGIPDSSLLDIEFPPESMDNYSGWEKMPVEMEDIPYDGIDLFAKYDQEHSVAYLKTEIWMNNSQSALFEMGSDGGLKVWLNGKLIHRNNKLRVHVQGQDLVEVKLAKGRNTILLKVGQGTLDWATSLVITDTSHVVLQKQ
jgi:hypothetical protein